MNDVPEDIVRDHKFFIEYLRTRVPHPQPAPGTKAYAVMQRQADFSHDDRYVYFFGKWYLISSLSPWTGAFHWRRMHQDNSDVSNSRKREGVCE